MGKASREKGKRRERKIAEFFNETMGWEAWRTAMQAHRRGDTPDVEVKSPVGILFVEVKDDAKLPGKTFLDAWDQAVGYCKNGEVPVLSIHRQGTSQDLVVMEKQTLLRIVEKK